MSRPDILAVTRIQKTDAPADVSSTELEQDGASTGAGLPVDELTQMIDNLKVKQKKPRVSSVARNSVSGQGVKPRGRRVAFV